VWHDSNSDKQTNQQQLILPHLHLYSHSLSFSHSVPLCPCPCVPMFLCSLVLFLPLPLPLPLCYSLRKHLLLMDFTTTSQIFCHFVCARILQSGKWQLNMLATPTASALASSPSPSLYPPLLILSLSLLSRLCHQRHTNLPFASFFIMWQRLKQHDVFIFHRLSLFPFASLHSSLFPHPCPVSPTPAAAHRELRDCLHL